LPKIRANFIEYISGWCFYNDTRQFTYAIVCNIAAVEA